MNSDWNSSDSSSGEFESSTAGEAAGCTDYTKVNGDLSEQWQLLPIQSSTTVKYSDALCEKVKSAHVHSAYVHTYIVPGAYVNTYIQCMVT